MGTNREMANNLIIRALRANPKSFSLSSKKIASLPKSIARLKFILALHLNNNLLSELPTELQALQQLTELNLGNNILLEIPVVLKHLPALRKLYLFGNKIESLPPDILDELPNLTLLNVNHNQIKAIPPQIKSLVNLEVFSIVDNQLEVVPAELGCLVRLTELNLTNNKVSSLPPQMCRLSSLRKLYLARNNLCELPEGISGCTSLKVLDVAGNPLSLFPTDFGSLVLEELFCEGNNFVRAELKQSVQEVEVLSLNELAARVVLMEDRNKLSRVHLALPNYPELVSMLSQWGRCALCRRPFLTTWLECVKFINLNKDMGMKRRLTVPVRAVLCSYSCFNAEGHSYYGVASTS